MKSKYSGGVNTFWVIQNKEPIIKAIKRLNKRKSARTIYV